MENLNKGQILGGAAILAVLAGIGLYFYQPSKVDVQTGTEDKVVREDMNSIDSYFRKDLNDAEKENLKVLLAQRDEKLKEMKTILDEAYKKSDMEDAWMEVNKMRDEIKASLLPYVSDEKKGDFEAFCYQQAEAFDSIYVQK